MKLSGLFRKNAGQPAGRSSQTSKFASFFLHASEKEKMAVIRKAAEESNRDQRETYARAQIQLKTQE
ncbi:MAG: hypothetical protein EXS55_01390 [Candidatus Magasanikbacteria bacterium]|nr:hypothetical protein [Candidatus Magasanikbacteria bacterium]